MTLSAPVNGYSAQVRLELLIGDKRYRLSQIGGGRIVFREAVSLSETAGEVISMVDGREQRWMAAWEPSDGPRKVLSVRLSRHDGCRQ